LILDGISLCDQKEKEGFATANQNSKRHPSSSSLQTTTVGKRLTDGRNRTEKRLSEIDEAKKCSWCSFRDLVRNSLARLTTPLSFITDDQ
jgi:hypothetical protein